MRLRMIFILLIVGISGSSLFWATVYLVDSGHSSFNNQIEDYLNSVIDVNAERIEDFIDEMEKDVSFLVQSGNTYDILRKDLVKNEEAAKLDVGGKVEVIAREVDNYLKLYPNMTLSDLQASEEFLSIAVQDIGKSGYSAALGDNNSIIYFHVDQKIIGSRLDDVTKSVSLLGIINQARATGFGGGFYDWIDIDGILRKKYIEVKVLGETTADDVRMMSATTTYIDDYLIAGDVSDRLNNYFEEFNNLKDYHNILFVSPEDLIVYMSKPMEGLGVEVSLARIDIEDISSKIDNLKKGEIAFYGPFIRHRSALGLQLVSVSKVYDGSEFLGSVILIKKIDDFKNILEEEEGASFGKKDEDYLVNKNGLLITPLRTRNVDVLVQEVKTASVEECIEDFNEAKELGMTVKEYIVLEKEEGLELEISPFQNFEGDLTYGLYRPIGRVEWCLLSEVSADEVLNEPWEKSFNKHVVFRTWVFFLIVVLVLFASLFVDKRYVLKKRKYRKYPCGYFGAMRPISCMFIGGKCRTYPNGRCGKIIKGRGFFINLKMRYYFLFALVFAITYFFIVTSFFQGWQNAKLFDDIPDLFIMVIGIMIFAVGVKIRKVNARGYIMLGGLLIFLRRVFDIPFQEWQELLGVFIGAVYWIPVVTIEFVGFLFLLIGYRRLKYD